MPCHTLPLSLLPCPPSILMLWCQLNILIKTCLIGPLPPSKVSTYFFTCINSFTCWPDAIPISNITTDSVAQAFFTHWIVHFWCSTQLPLTMAYNSKAISLPTSLVSLELPAFALPLTILWLKVSLNVSTVK